MATVVHQQAMSDEELIGATRTGDSDAYGELYRRHVDAARAAARALCRNRSDADDIVSEAFAKLLRVLHNGNGPDVAFRPYLLTAVRNCFYDKARRKRVEVIDERSEELNLAMIDGGDSVGDKALIATAFAALPERWQLVLWHTEVEGRSPAEIAPLLGLAPNAVAALAYRAREGLREAFLQAHLRTPRQAACRVCVSSLGAYVRDGLPARERRKVDDHLWRCESCRAVLAELTDTNTTLRAALIPAIIGVPAAAYISGLGGKGLLAWFANLPRFLQAGAGTAGAAAAVAVGATLVSVGGNATTIATPTTSSPGGGIVNEFSIGVESATIGPTAPPTITIADTPTADTPTAATRTIADILLNGTPIADTPAADRGLAATTVPPGLTPSGPAVSVPAVLGLGPITVTPSSIAVGSALPVPSTLAGTITVPATTVPLATVPTVPTPPTIPVSIVAELTLTSAQLDLALPGTEVRVQVSAEASDALSDVVVSVDLPADVTLLGADNAAWSCTSQGVCTISSLAAGSPSTAVLRLGLSLTTLLPISFAPSVAQPADAIVHSLPILIIAGLAPLVLS